MILRFLETQGSVLLLQGSPGTGKTTMAMEILRNSSAARKVYASSRTSPTKMRQHFPFIDEVMDSMSGRVARSNWMTEFQDIRGGDSDNVFNRVLRLKHLRESALMVVDSWEGALRNMTDEGRGMLESAILSELEDSKLSIVLITEGSKGGELGHLVDGIVTLSAAEIEGRVTRSLIINKLRGRRVPINRTLFSLEGGRFTLLPSSDSPVGNGGSVKANHTIPHSKTQYSTGSSDLDKLLGGGIRKGAFMLIEQDTGVSPERVRMLLNSIYSNFLNQGGSSFSVPFGNFSPEYIVDSWKPYIATKLIEDRARVAAFNSTGPQPRWKVPFKGTIREDAAIFQQAWNNLDNGSPKMLVIDYDKLLQVYGDDETFTGMAGLGEGIRDSGALNIGLASRHTRLREELVRAADYHLKLKSHEAFTLLFGLKPYTPIYGVQFDVGEGPPILTLTPMV